MITIQESDALVALVRDVAQAEILPRFRRLDATQVRIKSSDHDLVTEADLAAEHVLTARLPDILSGVAVVGEEAVSADPDVLDRLSQPGRVVLVDPVDGTWNFSKGLAMFGVILAVVENGRTIWGLLYDPVIDDWIIASEGQGAWHCAPNRAPKKLSTAASTEAQAATGFVPLYLFQGAEQKRIAQAMTTVGRAHCLRCSCHEYRLMAQGHVDFVLSNVLNPWDHAAGVLICREAGATATLYDGTPYAPRHRRGGVLTATSDALRRDLIGRFIG